MANNAEAARARRKLKATGAKRLGHITVADPATWTEILHEKNVLPFWRDGKELTDAQLRDATEALIGEWCQRRRRQKAERMLQHCEKIRTGAIEREPPPDPAEPTALSWRPSAGGHWSYRTGVQKDKGRVYTDEEIVELLEGRPDLREEITERRVNVTWVTRLLRVKLADSSHFFLN
jgi:hypothetical protein